MAASRNTLPDLLDAFLAHWPDVLSGQCRFEVGLSGGIDSMVLLDLLWRARERRHFSLSACHVHHGLSAFADEWAESCRRRCGELNVTLRVVPVIVTVAPGQSLEAVARQRRYEALAASVAQVVVLAHHLDDQVETVLLQTLRGGGVRALAAMPDVRELGDKQLWRPLLRTTREQIQAYADWRGLRWVEDDSNGDTRWRRNLLRHDVVPTLARAMPDYRRHVLRCAGLMADAAQILDEVAAHDLSACLHGGRLDSLALAALSPARQRQVLLRWLDTLGLGTPAPRALETFRLQIQEAGGDRNPRLELARGALIRYRTDVWVDRASAPPAVCQLDWGGGLVRRVEGWRGTLHWEEGRFGLSLDVLRAGYSLRPRQGGERLGMSVGAKPVKSLLQEAGIPPHLRSRWPLLFLSDGRLAALPGVAVDANLSCADGYWPRWDASTSTET